MAEVDRERAKKMRSEYNQTATNVLEVLDEKPTYKVQELTKENLRILDERNEKEEAFPQGLLGLHKRARSPQCPEERQCQGRSK